MTFRTILLALAGGAALPATARADAAALEFFEKNVRPVLAERCLECHGPKRHENGLRFDTQAAVTRGSDYGKVVEPGNPAASKLIKALRHQPGVEPMPKKGPALAEAQIKLIEQWIAQGAAWPEDRAVPAEKPAWQSHWAFQPVKKPAQTAKAAAGGRTSIDSLVGAKLAAAKLDFAPAADAATLCRRLHLDITGLLPDFAEVERFKADHGRDPQGAVSRLADQLLASPHYGERWGRYWLDVARYSDTEGYQVAGKDIRYPYAYTYRDWVIHALNEDMGYDRFVTLQLAADHVVQGEDKRDLAALGFLTVNDTFISNRDLQIDDRIDVTARGMLGLTVGCARCHDHKYDPIPSKDYYALYSIFSSSQIPDELPVIGRPASDTAFASFKQEVDKVEAKRAAFRQEVYDDMRKPERLAAYLGFVHEAKVKNLADSAYRGRAGQLQLRDRVAKKWSTLMEQTAVDGKALPAMKAWAEFAKLPEGEFAAKAPEILAKITAPDSGCLPEVVNAFKERPAPKSFADVAATYAALFLKHQPGPAAENNEICKMLQRPASPMTASVNEMEGFFTRKDMETMVLFSNEMKRLELTSPGAPPRAMVMSDRPKPEDVSIFIRGNPARRGAPAPRGNLTMLGGQKFTQGSGRLELARAITSRDNPLTARVIVNRVWMQHFGRPLVPTPSDFGVQTAKPEQVELLNWLTASFMDEGWSLKKLHRLIVTSRTWQQSTQSTPDKDVRDAENALLSRFNRTRLDYEAMRDAVSMVTGSLNPGQIGGRSVPLKESNVDTWRTVYHFVDRYDQATVPAMFDFANPDQHSSQRITTTVPQQALFLMNSPYMTKQADTLAAALPLKNGVADSGTVKSLYQRVLQREPSARETERALSFVSDASAMQDAAPFRWSYGTARLERSSSTECRLIDWTPFKVLKDANAKRPMWTYTGKVPDERWHYAMQTRQGGHAASDGLCIVMRWQVPADMTVVVRSQLERTADRGDGVRGIILSSRDGLLKEELADPAHKQVDISAGPVKVKKGDELQFLVSAEQNTDSDSYQWMPRIERVLPGGGTELLTDSSVDFCDANRWPLGRSQPQRPLSQLSQVLLMSNEFMFAE